MRKKLKASQRVSAKPPPPSIARPTCIGAIAGKYAAAAPPKAAQAKDTPFGQGGAGYRAKAAPHGITAETRVNHAAGGYAVTSRPVAQRLVIRLDAAQPAPNPNR